MTEQMPPSGSDPDATEDEPRRTGLPEVDDVLADIERLHGQPVEEHLLAFERADESLRAALDAEPGDPA